MYYEHLDALIQYGSTGDLAEELQLARREYVHHTGDLLQSDPSYEVRIAAFFEWYLLDRSLPDRQTPLLRYVEQQRAMLTTDALAELRQLSRSHLSVFEFRKAKDNALAVVDLLSHEKRDALERRRVVGLEAGDLLHARLVPAGASKWMFSNSLRTAPREARRVIKKAARTHGKNGGERMPFVHRVDYLTNRCERYKHLDVATVFAELLAQ
jgi:hypothetical protein